MRYTILLLVILGLCGCVASHQSLNDIDKFDSDDHEIILGMIGTLQSSLNSRDVEKWFSLYSEDAIITHTKNMPTPKKDVVASIESQDVTKWKFKIEDVKIIDTKIENDRAMVKTILKMNTGNSVKDHPETYYFKKTAGKWLIEKETNP